MIRLETDDLHFLISLCREAGAAVLEVYSGQVEVQRKEDASPLTLADLRSHAIITEGLRARFPDVPVVSEESVSEVPYEVRREWRQCWMVDPLDGTKEFIKRNGQFTINIALVQDARPVAGLVFAPALDRLYYGTLEGGAYKIEAGQAPLRLPVSESRPPETRVIVGSLSHPSPEMDEYVAGERRKYGEVQFVAMGSSLKICLVAEGRADVYPRLGPTMEWDTAAAHAVAAAAGRQVLRYGTNEPLLYNKEDLHNPWFIVEAR